MNNRNDVPVPNFLIIGAARSGTTTLFNCLEQHSDIFMPTIKEPCYFSVGWPHWVETWEEYCDLFSGVTTETCVGEASTSYLTDPDAHQRIHDRLGKIKIIALLRNPVKRAYSQWGHARYHENLEENDFYEALQLELDLINSGQGVKESPEDWLKYRYVTGGFYAEQLQPYLKTFGDENVKVMIFEEFIQDPLDYCREVFSFLGVDSSFTPDIIHKNLASKARVRFLDRLIAPPPEFAVKLYRQLPAKIRESVYKLMKWIHHLNHSKVREKEEISEEIQDMLYELYLPSIYELEKLLGRDLSMWYETKNPIDPENFIS